MGRHAAPAPVRLRTAAVLLPVGSAVVALVAAVALIGGPATIAYLNATAEQPAQTISAGGLTMTVTKAEEWVSTGAAAGSTVVKSTAGLVPGIRGQKITFTIANAADSAVPGTLSGTVSAAKTAAWSSLEGQGLIQTSAAAGAGCQIGPLSDAGSGLSFPVSSTEPLAPGDSCTVAVTLSIPATGSSGQDAATAVKETRLSALADFQLAATLTQAPRSEAG